MSAAESYAAVTAEQRRVLWTVLGLNVFLVAMLATTGAIADSSGLMANALDNASDAAVYALSLFAVGRPPQWKRVAAASSGVLLTLFGVGVLGDTLRRFLSGSEPIGPTMMVAAMVAAAINFYCYRRLERLGDAEVHLRTAEKFSFNDFIANGGVLVAGALVFATGRNWPDLIVGLIVAAVALKGGLEIINEARRT